MAVIRFVRDERERIGYCSIPSKKKESDMLYPPFTLKWRVAMLVVHDAKTIVLSVAGNLLLGLEVGK